MAVFDSVPIPTVCDRRVKLTQEQKDAIRDIRANSNTSLRELSRMFGVDKRMIGFICDPTKLEENKARRAERGGSMLYYTTEKNTETVRKCRKYKKQLVDDGKIVLPPNKIPHTSRMQNDPS